MIETVGDNRDGVEAYVTMAEACEITGYSAYHMAQLCREGKAPCHQSAPRAQYRFLISELKAWMRGE